MSKRKKKPWSYHKVKITPGEYITSYRLAEAGDLCKTWPSTFSLLLPMDTYCGNYEYIDYYIKSKPYVEQPCFHIKNSVNRYELPSFSFETVATHKCTDGTYKRNREVNTLSNYYGHSLADGYRLPDLPALDQCHREALEFFASGCQPLEANWAVNLFEVAEMIKLATVAWKALKLFKKLAAGTMPYSWSTFLRRFSRLNSVEQVSFLTNTLSKEAANAFLAYSFAISPLLSDIKSTTDVLNGLSARIAFFRKNNKIPTKVSFSKNLSDAFAVQPTSFPPVEDVSTSRLGVNIFRTQYAARYTATAYATYDVSNLKDNDIAYRLAKKAFGFADPLVFLWEIIPFSFVLDWIVNVGDYLASLPSLSTFPYVLSRVTHSLSVQQTNVYLRHYYVGNIYTPRIIHQQPVFTDVIDFYDRKLGIPTTFSGMDTSLPGFQQLMLALALGRQLFK